MARRNRNQEDEDDYENNYDEEEMIETMFGDQLEDEEGFEPDND